MSNPENNNSEHRISDLGPASAPVQDLIDYLLIIARHKKMILSTTFVAAVIAVLFSLTLTKIYTAKTLILPNEDDKNSLMTAMASQFGGLAGIAGGALGKKTKEDLYVTLLKSETLKDKIIDRFKLLEVYKTKYRMSAYKALDRNTQITIGTKDSVITIMVDDKDPKRAADMANVYVDELTKMVTNLSISGARDNKSFLDKRITEAHADLVKAEDALKNFQSKNKAISIPDQAKATIEGVAQLRAQLAMQEIELATLKRQLTDSSQEVKNKKAAIVNLRTQIASLEGKGEGRSSIPNIGSLPQLGQEYLRLMRDFKIQETVLVMLVKQHELASLNEVKDVSQIQVIQIANVPEQKSKPSRAKIVVIITLFSFILSVAYVFVKESLARMSEDELLQWKKLRGELSLLRKFDKE